MKAAESNCDSALSTGMIRDDFNRSLSSYQKEWESLFNTKFYLEQLRSAGIKGSLRNSHFRSICWKVYLECLPENQQLWIDKAKSQRQKYELILDKFHTNPRSSFKYMDANLDNPLSQSVQSPWNQYFQDSELKVTIQQDVVRTFPEIEFFHTPEVQKMMINILFSYAREFPHISYKQGMHELLAPIIFVLHYDQQAYLHASETDSLDLDIHILLNQNYIEHDAFFLFSQLMEAVEAWYTMTDCFFLKHRNNMVAEPFYNSPNSRPNNSLGLKLKKIYEHHLKRYDPELFSYLEQMEITPQIYGIRWLRLLFGREFAMHDLLVIWDAIFSDSVAFDLVDYIFVAMLVSIRDFLLHSDYASILSHLMRYPNVMDVHYIIDLALHLRDPHGNAKPTGCSVQITKPVAFKAARESNQPLHKTFTKSLFPGQIKLSKQSDSSKRTDNRPKTLKIARTGSLPSSEPPTLESSPVFETDINEQGPSTSGYHVRDKYVREVLCQGSSYTLPRTTIRNVMENRDHKFKASDLSQSLGHLNDDKPVASSSAYKEMVPLVPHSTFVEHSYKKGSKLSAKEKTEELHLLREEVSELKSMNQYCVQQMSIHLEKLQESVVCQSLQFEDKMLIALAGLKRTRDILKGTVSFTQEVIGDDDINPYSHILKNCTSPLSEVSACDEVHPENVDDFVIVQGEMCDGNSSVTDSISESPAVVKTTQNDASESSINENAVLTKHKGQNQNCESGQGLGTFSDSLLVFTESSDDCQSKS